MAAKLPDPGEFDQEIDIMEKVGGTDEMGGGTAPSTVPVYSSIAARFRRPTSREVVAAQTKQSEITWYVAVFYRDGIQADHLILHRGKWYEITGEPIDLEMAHIYLEMPVTYRPSMNPLA